MEPRASTGADAIGDNDAPVDAAVGSKRNTPAARQTRSRVFISLTSTVSRCSSSS